MAEKKKRSFKMLDAKGNKVGDFQSSTPDSAAKKAFSKRHPGKASAVVTVVETTRGSKNKKYKYKVSRIKVNQSYKVKDSSGKVKTIKIGSKIVAKAMK